MTFDKAHIPNIPTLNSDTHAFRIQYEYTQKQCVGVAIEGIDIWYMDLILPKPYIFKDRLFYFSGLFLFPFTFTQFRPVTDKMRW